MSCANSCEELDVTRQLEFTKSSVRHGLQFDSSFGNGYMILVSIEGVFRRGMNRDPKAQKDPGQATATKPHHKLLSIVRILLINLCVLVIVLGACLTLAEFFLRVFIPQPVDYFSVPKYPEPGMALPVMGKTVRLNAYGSRDKDYSRRKRPGVTRIAVIGDSITFGFGVALEDTYHKLLEDKLNSIASGTVYEVPSFNMGAADTLWAMNKYVTLVRGFHPDVVILGFCLNDILDYSESASSGEADHREIPINRRIINTFLRYHYLLRRYSHVYFLCMERTKPLLYKTFLDIRTKNPEYWVPLETDTQEYKVRFVSTVDKLIEFKNLVAADGVRFIVVIFPYEIQLSDDHVAIYEKAYRLEGYRDAPKAEVQRQLRQALTQNGIECLDLLDAYRAYIREHPQSDLFFRSIVGIIDWMHPNEAGHRVAAEAIEKYVRNIP